MLGLLKLAMIYYVCAALIGCTVGVVAMKTIQKFLPKLKEFEENEVKERRRVKHEVCAFKERGTRYFVRKFENGSIELWAWNEEGDFFLGNWTEDDGFISAENFRELDWQIQRATERLRSYMLGNDFRLRGNWQ